MRDRFKEKKIKNFEPKPKHSTIQQNTYSLHAHFPNCSYLNFMFYKYIYIHKNSKNKCYILCQQFLAFYISWQTNKVLKSLRHTINFLTKSHHAAGKGPC